MMKVEAQPSDREVLAGLVERVTYQNVDNGFCVVRVKARGHRDLFTLVGHAATISAGEWITATGGWVNDRTHGQQFKAQFLKTSAPSSVEGIEKYLASGMIRGIGPVYAKRLLHAFGEKVFDVIEAEPDRLRSVNGIGAVRASRIVAAWAEQKVVPRDHGVPAQPWCRHRTSSAQPTAPMPCGSCRKTRIAWPATFVASASRPPTRSP
jgi:exodeoxyribonuclease V alpha subunit